MSQRALPFVPRLLKAPYAAAYLGVSETKFRDLAGGGSFPAPREFGGNVVWDVRDLDEFADSLPRRGSPANDDWEGIGL